MRVMTMDGGFRGLRAGGLGDLASSRDAARAWFVDRINPSEGAFDDVVGRLVEAREAGLLPARDAATLVARHSALQERIEAHMAALEHFTSETSLASWRTVSEAIVADARAWVNDVRRIIGDERGGRILRTVLLVGGAATLFGGATYVLWRAWR